MKNPIETEFTKQLAHTHPQLPKAWMPMREVAQLQFENFGLPHRRIEAWKYTDLRSVIKSILPPANTDHKPTDISLNRPFADAAQLVFMDGIYVPKQSAARPQGVSILSLEQALSSDLQAQVEAAFAHPELKLETLVALNTALKTSVWVLHVQAGVHANTALNIHNLFVQSAAFYTHLIVILEDGAEVELIETQQLAGPMQRNHIFQASLGAGAKLTHSIIADDAQQSLNLRSSSITMGADSIYNAHSFVVNCPLSRHSMWVDINGEGAHPNLSGVQLVDGNEHQDITIKLNHNAPHTTSMENFKSVVRGQGVAVFQGKIHVAKPAQKTDAKMRANGILLTEGAEFYAKPELEIYADDVLCAHGATCGAIDEEMLFYMMARGIPETEAKALLVQAFVGDALEAVENDTLRDALMAKVREWLI